MNRKTAFENLARHPYYGPLMARLRPFGREQCLTFIENNDRLDADEFAMAASRLFLGSTAKPKNLGLMIDLLLAANAAVRDTSQHRPR